MYHNTYPNKQDFGGVLLLDVEEKIVQGFAPLGGASSGALWRAFLLVFRRQAQGVSQVKVLQQALGFWVVNAGEHRLPVGGRVAIGGWGVVAECVGVCRDGSMCG